MRIFRFDPEVSVPIDRFGSNFRIGRLTEGDARGRVQVLHLPPGGLVGRHAAGERQLFAVVAGSGWVSGADGERRPIRTGQAAVWDRGEVHGAGSDQGLTAVCVEGTFEMQAVAVTEDIAVVGYDPAWRHGSSDCPPASGRRSSTSRFGSTTSRRVSTPERQIPQGITVSSC